MPSTPQPDEPGDLGDDGDRELLRRIAGADRQAFQRLYLGYHGRLVRFLSRTTRHYPDVEEIINDVLLIVWQHARDFRGASRVSTWIFGIAYRCALNCLRRGAAQSRLIASEGEGHEGCTEDASRATEEQQLLNVGLACLPPEQRLVLVLAYRMDYSCAEIAAIVDCPVNTVKTRMFHARRKLHEVLCAAALPSDRSAPAPVGRLLPA